MTFATLVRGNLRRKPARSVLLVLSIAIAFFVYGVLASFATGFRGTDDDSGRLVVTSKVSSNEPLPIGLIERIERIDGVKAVSHTTRLRAWYREPRNILGASAVDPAHTAIVFGSDFDLTPELLQRIGALRAGALVGRALADSQGWRVGQRIALTSPAYRRAGGGAWDFEIVGIFEGRRSTVDTNFLMVRYDYVNAARLDGRDTVGGFSILPASRGQAEAVARAVDAAFANSGSETRTTSEVAFMQAFMAQLADIDTIITLVVGAAFVTLLMIVANTMVFAVRERTAEIGVLKTIGFTGRSILALVLAETLALGAIGGLAGIGLALVAVDCLGGELGLVFTPEIALSALALIAAVGLSTGLLPAIGAMRTPILATFRPR